MKKKRLKSIHGFTEYKLTIKNVHRIIRCCPTFRSNKDWYDWVIAKWDKDGLLEGQCLLFLDFKKIVMEDFDMADYNYTGMYNEHEQFAKSEAVLIHSVKYHEDYTYDRQSVSQKKSDSCKTRICNRLVQFKDMEDTYQIISVDNIYDTTFVIPIEYKNLNESYLIGCASKVMVLSKSNLWSKLFVDYESEDLIKEAEQRKNEEILDNDERSPFES